jgi:hypothetical protein
MGCLSRSSMSRCDPPRCHACTLESVMSFQAFSERDACFVIFVIRILHFQICISNEANCAGYAADHLRSTPSPFVHAMWKGRRRLINDSRLTARSGYSALLYYGVHSQERARLAFALTTYSVELFFLSRCLEVAGIEPLVHCTDHSCISTLS